MKMLYVNMEKSEEDLYRTEAFSPILNEVT